MTTSWMTAFIGRLALRDIPVQEEAATGLAPARQLLVNADDWGRLAQEAKNWECRWVAAWGEDRGEEVIVNVCFEKEGDYVIARTHIEYATPILTSHTPWFAAADRPERHIQDMLGIVFTDHPDSRRWTRHRAWKDSE